MYHSLFVLHTQKLRLIVEFATTFVSSTLVYILAIWMDTMLSFIILFIDISQDYKNIVVYKQPLRD